MHQAYRFALDPSSKRCSGCGEMRDRLRLSERVYRCAGCGLVLDRDLNAARNLAALVETVEVGGISSSKVVVAGSGPETENARRGGARPGVAGRSSKKREASGPGRDGHQTGTAGSQGSDA